MTKMNKIYTQCCLLIACIVSLAFVSCKKETPSTRQPYVLPGPVSGINYSADEVTAFKQLTLNATNGSIVKLPSHVSVYLVDTAYSHMSIELDSIIREVNGLLDISLLITRTPNRNDAHLQVYLTDRATYIQNESGVKPTLENSNYTGMAYDNWNEAGVVYRGSVFVDMQKTAGDTLQQRYLIHHEMMHALGFLGHVSLPQFYTIMFSYALAPYIIDYTPFDKKMMQLLYNPAIKAGMSEKEFDAEVIRL